MDKEKGTLKNDTQNKNEGHKKSSDKNNEGHKNDELKELVKSLISEELAGAKQAWEKDMETRVTAEREDAARLASMSAEERAKFEMEKKQKDFEEERQQYVSERAEFEAAKELAAQNLPVTFAHMLADADKETTVKNISAFKAEYLKAIEAGLYERLKGKTPKISREVPEGSDPFLNGLGI